MPLLLVEDNSRLAAPLCRGLGEEGFEVVIEPTGLGAVERLLRRDVDLAVLDLGLPDIDGIEVIRRARAAAVATPILVLTARDGLAARVEALDLGADDYLVKPFAFAELLARVKALYRRAAAPRWAPLTIAGVALHMDEAAVTIEGRPVPLSPRERALLEVFVRRRGDVVSRADLLRESFGYTFDPGTNVVDVHLASIRRKLATSRLRIETVRGAGFRLHVDDAP